MDRNPKEKSEYNPPTEGPNPAKLEMFSSSRNKWFCKNLRELGKENGTKSSGEMKSSKTHKNC